MPTLNRMAKHNLYAYAIGLEFSAYALRIVEHINEFIASRQWVCPDIWAVNQRRTAGDWELGFNLSLPDPYQEIPGWYADVEAVVGFCCQLRSDFGYDFVVGIADSQTGIAEDIIEVQSDQPDYDYLRQFIGVQPPSPGSA